MSSKLYYITQDHPQWSHVELCEKVCKAGVRLVQLRMKNANEALFLAAAMQCIEITKTYGAQLIINDKVEIALKCQADGVHVGQEDLSVKEVRALLGPDALIGGTANTFEQVLEHAANGANYVGVGPYRFTETKKNLSPVLGLEGYRKILKQLKQEAIQIPLYAIGGIQAEDLKQLAEAGVYGVAVSGLLSSENVSAEMVHELMNQMNYADA